METTMYSHIDDIALKVARRFDEIVEACFVLLGIDKQYVIENKDEFRVELYPERRVFYQNDIPLFAISEKVDFDVSGMTATVTHEIEILLGGKEVSDEQRICEADVQVSSELRSEDRDRLYHRSARDSKFEETRFGKDIGVSVL